MDNKLVLFTKTFSSPDTFVAYHDAEKWLQDRGFSVGRMQGPEPVGIKRGDYDIQKWRNINSNDRELLDGLIVGDDKRNGPVTINLYTLIEE